jgi:response regulator RpfG family c-di-GMP phosphodiesterase
MTTHEMINVLYVDDEENNLISFVSNFRRYFNVFTALSAKEAEVTLSENDIHVLITDQRMPIKLGTELLVDSVKKYPEQTRIIMTAFNETIEIKEAIKKGYVFRSMEKPWNEEELKDAIILGYESYIWKITRKKIIDDLDNNAKQ